MKQWHCYNFRLPDQRGHYSLSSHWPGPLDTVLPLAGSPSSVTVHHHRLGQCHDISVVPECRPLIGQKLAGDNVTHNVTTNNPLSCMAVNMKCQPLMVFLLLKYFTSPPKMSIAVKSEKVNLVF